MKFFYLFEVNYGFIAAAMPSRGNAGRRSAARMHKHYTKPLVPTTPHRLPEPERVTGAPCERAAIEQPASNKEQRR